MSRLSSMMRKNVAELYRDSRRTSRAREPLLLMLYALCVGCGGSGLEPVSLTVDPSIMEGPAALADQGLGERPLVQIVDSKGAKSAFIENEVLFEGSEAEVDAFVARTHGTVLTTTEPPPPPPGIVPRPASNFPKRTLIRLDPMPSDLSKLAIHAQAIGISGRARVSSDAGAHLLSLALSETAAGHRTAPNFVSSSNGYLYGTQELYNQNAFSWPEFGTPAYTVDAPYLGYPTFNPNVSQSWQFVARGGFVRRVKVALIDGGFWLDTNGNAKSDPSGRSDLPNHPVQYDFVGRSYRAGGPNPAQCTGGSPCPWHGNKSASVATAILDNQTGAAGTGGQVADPFLFKVDLSDGAVITALNTAVSWGADIVSMSFSSDCNMWCRGYRDFNGFDSALDRARDAGLLLVAAAGNDGKNLRENDVYPCEYDGVFCVGALSGGGRWNSASYSNYGPPVSIWAPTNVRAMPDGDTGGTGLTMHTGTSASCPYVAGVAAMMKAVNPSLSADAIKNILTSTAFVAQSLDFKVTAAIQPFPALLQAAGGYHLAPDVRITSPSDNSTSVVVPFRPLAFSGNAADVRDGALSGAALHWSSDVDGPLGAGADINFDFTNAPEGPRRITLTASNSAGISSSNSIRLTLRFVHNPPTPIITWPAPNAIIAPATYWLSGYARSTDPGVIAGNLPCDRLLFNNAVRGEPVPNDPSLCRAQWTWTAADVGAQVVTLSATNRLGDVGRSSTSVTIRVPQQRTLAVQILSPIPGATYSLVMGGLPRNVALSGSASPIEPRSTVSYSWFEYTTAQGVATKRLIGAGANFLWPMSDSVCGTETRIHDVDLTIRLEVVDDVPSDPSRTTSGASEVPIRVTCNPPPR